MSIIAWLSAALVALLATFFGFIKPMRDKDKKIIDLEVKGAKDEAKEIVEKKTAGDLLDSFNSRYPPDSKS